MPVYNSTAGDGVDAILAYGTGTAPSAGSDLSSYLIDGTQMSMTSSADGERMTVTTFHILSLSAGTTYWIDVGIKAVTGGTAYMADGSKFVALEV
jgi:hypothetical protein